MKIETEIDSVDAVAWNKMLMQFDDASIYQAYSTEFVGKEKKLSHIVIKRNGEIFGCCQIRIKHFPIIRTGIADIVWGPLCCRKGATYQANVLDYSIKSIKKEYATKRGYLLRISPNARGEKKEILKEILEREGFKKNMTERPYRTFILDLSLSIEELRKNFLQKWRNCLNKAERNKLRIVEGTSDDLYKKFMILGKKMVERKELTKAHNDSFLFYRRIQQSLPEDLRMKIMICEADGEPVCATICSAIGNTGIYLLGATGEKALKLNGSYLLQWRMIKWLKESGFCYYDLGAFNAEINPGVFHFKKGIAGKRGLDETFLGDYYGWFNFGGRVAKLCLDMNNFKNKMISKFIAR